MDEQLGKQLVRQLKFLNFWITFFGTIFLIGMILLGILLFRVAAFVHDSSQKLTEIQTKTTETLDFKSELCQNSLAASSSICKQ